MSSLKILEQIYRIRQKSTGLYMHTNSLSWSPRGNFFKTLEEAQNAAYWNKLDSINFEIMEYALKEEKAYEIS